MGGDGRAVRLPASLRVLRHRNFRRVAIGTFVSSLGTWSSMVGIGWAARNITDSPQAITLAFAAQFLPNLLFAPFGGLLADRVDRRRLMIVGSIVMAVPPAAIGLLLSADLLTLQLLMALAFSSGVAASFTMPAGQALVPRLVPEGEVQLAISLTSALMNSSRLVGSALAGVIISTFGTPMAFYWNAVSFMAVVLAWTLVRIAAPPATQDTESFFLRLAGGLRYARRVPTVRNLLLLNIVMALLIMQAPLLPVLVKDVLHADVSTYALLQMGTGVGAVTGALVAGQWTTDDRRRRVISIGMLINAAAVIGIAFSRWVPVSVALQAVFGVGFFTTSTITQSMIMVSTEDAYRGRVMALHTMALAGMLPFNAVLAGFLASHFGTVSTIGGAGVLLVVYALWFTAVRLPGIGVDEPPDTDTGTDTEAEAEAGSKTVAGPAAPAVLLPADPAT